jgi:hypothetical protein
VQLRGFTVDFFAAVADASQVADAEFALVTFQRFVDHLWLRMSSLAGVGLSALPWSSPAWARADGKLRDSAQGAWRARLQRRLWGR